MITYFNPRSPRGERRLFSSESCSCPYFNPRSPRGERRLRSYLQRVLPRYFNPRSPRGERPRKFGLTIGINHFNPRSPRGERLCKTTCGGSNRRFQSTLPAGGATPSSRCSAKYPLQFQSTLPAGGATICDAHSTIVLTFQSTLPAGGATYTTILGSGTTQISIHAPRGGSDRKVLCQCR